MASQAMPHHDASVLACCAFSCAAISFCLCSCSMICLDQLPGEITVSHLTQSESMAPTYYLLGKKRSGSGILCRYSRSALSFQVNAVMPKMTRLKIAVLAFQLAGCAYQPPAGDQTCLG